MTSEASDRQLEALLRLQLRFPFSYQSLSLDDLSRCHGARNSISILDGPAVPAGCCQLKPRQGLDQILWHASSLQILVTQA
jgi:hypothetical protein